MVMLLGQYSTGKTTFIKHLLKTSYPGLMLHLIKQILVSGLLAILFSIASERINI
jgi:septin family protein